MINKYIFLFSSFIFFIFCGCNSVCINDKQRIDGIVDAVWTSYYLEKDQEKINNYLEQKIERKEIDDNVKYTILSCLNRSIK